MVDLVVHDDWVVVILTLFLFFFLAPDIWYLAQSGIARVLPGVPPAKTPAAKARPMLCKSQDLCFS
jgi:hypothetical protein